MFHWYPWHKFNGIFLEDGKCLMLKILSITDNTKLLNLFLCRNWVLMLTCMLWCLENLFWMMRSVFCFFPVHKNSQCLYLWLTYLSPSLEWTDGNFSLQVCFWLWYDLFFLSHVFLAYVCASRQDNVISQKSCSSRRELFYDDSPVPWNLCWFNVIRLHFCSKFGCHLKFMKLCR